MRRPLSLVVLLVVLVACGANVREQTLRTTYTGVTAAQAGFLAWDRVHQLELAQTATTYEHGVEQLHAYHAAREPVLEAFEATYRALAAAAIADKDDESLFSAVRAFERLRTALRALTKGRVP